MSNQTGKTLTIFVVLIIILLTSSTSIGFYLYQLEKHWRKIVQSDLDGSRSSEAKLQATIKDLQGQLNLALDKNKEADQKINSLLDEKDLNESLRAALKKENVKLKEDIETINKTKEALRAQLDGAKAQWAQFQEILKAAETHVHQLEKAKKGLEDKIEEITKTMQAKIDALKAPRKPSESKVQLDKIVVNSKP